MSNRLATVLSAIALTVSLTGAGAYAATQVSGTNIKDGTIAAAKLTKAAKQSLRGQRGPAGPAGPAGADGYDGYDGKDGWDGAPGLRGGFDPTKVTYVGTATPLAAFPEPTSSRKGVSVCPPGTKVIAGGYVADDAAVTTSGPSSEGTAWIVMFENTTASPVDAGVFAVCAAP